MSDKSLIILNEFGIAFNKIKSICEDLVEGIDKDLEDDDGTFLSPKTAAIVRYMQTVINDMGVALGNAANFSDAALNDSGGFFCIVHYRRCAA